MITALCLSALTVVTEMLMSRFEWAGVWVGVHGQAARAFRGCDIGHSLTVHVEGSFHYGC